MREKSMRSNSRARLKELERKSKIKPYMECKRGLNVGHLEEISVASIM